MSDTATEAEKATFLTLVRRSVALLSASHTYVGRQVPASHIVARAAEFEDYLLHGKGPEPVGDVFIPKQPQGDIP